MACEKFKSLERQIRKECEKISATEKTVRYLINKASRLIKKAPHDIYELSVSLNSPKPLKGYSNHYSIEFCGGILFLNMMVD